MAEEDRGVKLALTAAALGMMIGSGIGGCGGNIAGYRRGQIDCLNNRVYYTLQKQNDGETSWEKIDNPITLEEALKSKGEPRHDRGIQTRL